VVPVCSPGNCGTTGKAAPMMDEGSLRPRVSIVRRGLRSLAIRSLRGTEFTLGVVPDIFAPCKIAGRSHPGPTQRVTNEARPERGLALWQDSLGWSTVCQATRRRLRNEARPERGLALCKTPWVEHRVPGDSRRYETKPGPSGGLALCKTPWGGAPCARRLGAATKRSQARARSLHCARLPGWNPVCQATRRRDETNPPRRADPGDFARRNM